ncbi:MAG TPA: tetratricopeptide repeat protein, partial [Rhodopila sp.]|nr:tetratricopeptide repeat protein [Rhodopila sp.]
MTKDSWGLEISTTSPEAAAAYDHAINGYLGYRADMPARLKTLLAADPDFGVAHSLNGCMMLAGFRADLLPAIRASLQEARRCGGTLRELAHAQALTHWADGDPERAVAVWDQIHADHPHDILAFRLAHFVAFWSGRPDVMLRSVLNVERHWSESLPGYSAILGCRCFALEESGRFLEAEYAGREAIRLNPGDLWAAHAVAHVLEMTGRRREGIQWVETLQPGWDGGNNLKHHLWWHEAMYHLELGDFARVLALYDSGFRDLSSPLTGAAPDLYIDVQNAASMLFRLQRHGIDVGDRWVELADKAEARIGDCQSAFTLPHWMMALAATGRIAATHRMLDAMRDFGAGTRPAARLVRDVALPVTEAVLANGQGRHAEAVRLMRPVLGEMWRMGGSHAQQDVLEQVFLDSALKGELDADARLLLERAAGRHPLPPVRRR